MDTDMSATTRLRCQPGTSRRPRHTATHRCGHAQGAESAADLRYVLNAARNIGRQVTGYRAVVDNAAVSVGTGDGLCETFHNKLNKRATKIPFSVVCDPEFLKEGTTVKDVMRLNHLIIGSRNARLLSNLHRNPYPSKRD